ncbi:hypothetical protein [Streptomyces sp. NPDC059452]|uniref:hypothetical protein n=1 Tax=Streptomyces sp. NPDC059452 TaxID=3346835 RepID=UPI0036A7D4AE
MGKLRKVLGSAALLVIALEIVLVLTGVIDFSSAAKFTIIMELCLAVFVIFEVFIIVKAIRAARASGVDFSFALEGSLAEFFPVAVARYVRQDFMLLRAIVMLLTGRRDVREQEKSMGYSGPLVAMLVSIAVVDGIVAFLLHLLLPPGVRVVALILGILGFVWLVGFIASVICYPHVVGGGRLRLRFSAFHDVVIPLSAINGVHAVSGQPESTSSAARVGEKLVMAVGGQANLAVKTADIVELTTLNPRLSGDPLAQVVFYVDDRRQAQELIGRAVAQG